MNKCFRYKKLQDVEVNDFASGNNGTVPFKLEVPSVIIPWTYIIMRKMVNACILGLDILKYTGAEVNIIEKSIKFGNFCEARSTILEEK